MVGEFKWFLLCFRANKYDVISMMEIKQLLVGFMAMMLHPFYVSITDVDYNEKERRIEVSCRIFYDDLEEALAADGLTKVDLINPSNRETVDSALSQYLRKNFRLAVNDEASSLYYVGYEIVEDVAWCYLESTDIASVREIAIDNRVLFGQFPKQSNILHVKVGGQRKSIKLDNPDSRAAFTF